MDALKYVMAELLRTAMIAFAVSSLLFPHNQLFVIMREESSECRCLGLTLDQQTQQHLPAMSEEN